ncbi:MAG: thiamine diphosphokinase [Candidatus Schekmanbacteria bacterium GWA2_38_9]|uniref:Thiamine diphosphokinase n=1 Tax=Candidatus Schekmanbacteria bacterium RIFCSPLOWO2_12_FULL_38_15 TaxID=1817883 RepID=A0A1F7SJW5_9BACT|nr:MAG: thiamine diphosphokinase [Candidatus Schekmanbacteria bacterium GWA2_38_9]OGL51753.1 MAG: thiamine diphosphokinase [Candidatus Schekmanbacteria bacterium RIFCSPLOWO2_02_FULL_38_14]OGL54076.1 MAG: thiamine diphosphokinase [Candidatus Schekmanbacteria bacterium RIFCSPLOWO2_12_FULL_38_15]
MSKKRVIIFSNGRIGDVNFYRKIIKKNDLIICADGGLKFAKKLGLKPDALIGDFDSLKEKEILEAERRGARILKFTPEKDKTDTQLALEYAISSGAKEIIMLGSLGGRIDHLLANLHLLKLGTEKGVEIRVVDENNEIRLIDSAITFKTKRGETLSLLPFSDKVTGIYTEGLKYSLENGTMVSGNPYGVSNVAVSSKVRIKIRSGLLMMIRNLKL